MKVKLFCFTMMIVGIVSQLKAQSLFVPGATGTVNGIGKSNTSFVGIGTSSPTQALQIDGTSGANVSLLINNGSNRAFFSSYPNKVAIESDNNIVFMTSYGGWSDKLTFTKEGKLGIGTSNPTQQMQIDGNSAANVSLLINNGNNRAFFSSYPNKVAIESDNNIVFMTSYGGWSDKLTFTKEGNLGIGISTPQNKLDVNGTIHAQEIKVDLTGWSDFVFHPSYQLKTLTEVEQYIKTNGHLENIPSTEEVMQSGVNMGEMQSKLLQKVEELTLYTIEQNKKLEEQAKINAMLLQKIEQLEKHIQKP